jgi:CBS domain-containing protein
VPIESAGSGKRVCIYIGEHDKAEGQHGPLWETILEFLRNEGAAGATMFRGLAGFGMHSRLHTARLADIAPDLPVVLEWIDSPDRVSRLLPRVNRMVMAGLITVEDIEVVKYAHRPPVHLPPDHVQDLMTQDVVTVRTWTPVGEVVRMLVYRTYRSLPVLDHEGRLVGIITNTDLVARGGLSARVDLLAALGGAALEDELTRTEVRDKTAGDVMSRDITTVGPGEQLNQAAHLMVEHGIKRLPVVDDVGRLAGMLSRVDILKAMGEAYPPPPVSGPPLPGGAHTVGDLMRSDVYAVAVDAPLGEALDAVTASPLNRAIVIDAEQRVVGIVTDADLLARLDPGDRANILQALMGRGRSNTAAKAVARDVMHSPPVTVERNASIEEAARRMVEARLKVLPVIDEGGRLLGAVDRSDLLAQRA